MENKAKKLILLEICLIFLLLRTGHKTYANICNQLLKGLFFLFIFNQFIQPFGIRTSCWAFFSIFFDIFLHPNLAPNRNLQNDGKSNFIYKYHAENKKLFSRVK